MRNVVIALTLTLGLVIGLVAGAAAPEAAAEVARPTVVVDNPDAELAPATAWQRSSSLPGYFGTNYALAQPGSSSAVARWRPELPEPGAYAIAVWLPHGNDQRSPRVEYRVHHAGQVTTFMIDQQQAGGFWLRGPESLAFDGGGAEYVELIVNDAAPSGSSQTYVIADAVRFTDPSDPPEPPGIPTGLAVTQSYGFATLTWDPVEAANEYQVERTPLDGDTATGPAEIVGRWLPDRHRDATGQPSATLTFADAGFEPGGRYRWRLRAATDGLPGDWSTPVADTTEKRSGPPGLLTEFELSGETGWTGDEAEIALLERIADASDRVRLETIAETYEGRPLHLAVVGDPPTGRSGGPDRRSTVLISCTVHGQERSGREACLILLRQLAFSTDPAVVDLLSRTTVLINPTANPDGQAAGRRTNSADQDLNRDHLPLRQPETLALAKIIRDYRPDMIIDAHEAPAGPDTAPMWSRSPTVDEDLWRLGQDDLTLGWHFRAGREAGWSLLPYDGWSFENWENWLHNVAGLKNSLGQLLETPSASGATRPNAPTNSAANLRRRVYTQLWSFRTLLDQHDRNLPKIRAAIAAAEQAQEANQGPLQLDGAYDPPFQPPRKERTTRVLDPAPCGYRLTPEQYAKRETGTLIGEHAGQAWSSATVGQRLAAHGIETEELGAGIVQVRLGQRLRAVIPYLLDPELDTATRPVGTPNLGIAAATRLDDRRPTVVVGEVDSGVANVVDGAGCSVNDLIADEQPWPSHTEFVRHVGAVVDALVTAGLLDERAAGEVRRAATASAVGR